MSASGPNGSRPSDGGVKNWSANTAAAPHTATTAVGASSAATAKKSTPQRYKPSPASSSSSSSKNGGAVASQTRVVHQRTSLSFVYLNHNWCMEGRTSLYLILDDEQVVTSGTTSDTVTPPHVTPAPPTRQVALHLRSGCTVQEMTVCAISKQEERIPTAHIDGGDTHSNIQNDTEQNSLPPQVALRPLSASFQQLDPLAQILRRPASLCTTTGDGTPPNASYEADSQSIRGGTGMTNAIRAASVASVLGELRISFQDPHGVEPASSSAAAAASLSNKPKLKLNLSGAGNSTTQKEDTPKKSLPVSKDEALDCWINDLAQSTSSYEFGGALDDGNMTQRLHQNLQIHRCSARRKKRIQLIAKRLSEASCLTATTFTDTTPAAAATSTTTGADNLTNEKGVLSTAGAVRITIRYTMDPKLHDGTDVHLGGIHFMSSPQAPHVYTTVGVHGDHEGPRSWIPCLDSALARHRATHELSIKVTAPMDEGILPVGCGEDFGLTDCILHDTPSLKALDDDTTENNEEDGNEEMLEEQEMELAIKTEVGCQHLAFTKECLRAAVHEKRQLQQLNGTRNDSVHLIPMEDHVEDAPETLATCVWATAIWSPIPPRSLGFAVGPFHSLYDPEYYSNDEEDDDEDAKKEADDDEEEEDAPTIGETALKDGEGIRQVYLCPNDDRMYIHSRARRLTTLHDYAYIPQPRWTDAKNQMTQAILMATKGVPNRALALMRDILAFPSYRTCSYTQVWIPNAVHGGTTSGALHTCPEVLCNPFLGGAVMDSRNLPPPGYRLPYYAGGRLLQFLQARCVIRGWITAALPMGTFYDDIGMGYIHSVFESFLMSLYARGHGAIGEGGARGSAYYSKRFAISSGLNSPNLDFLPVINVEEEELDAGILGAVAVEERTNDQLWRSPSNGTESHTSSGDEFAVRQVLFKDIVDALERGPDRFVSSPSMGWLGSYLSLSFLSSNSTSSTAVGCGALELVHPVGGLTYRALKSALLCKILEGRAGVSNFVRVIRAAFIAAYLDDEGESKVTMPDDLPKDEKTENKVNDPKPKEPDSKKEDDKSNTVSEVKEEEYIKPRPSFVVCIDELLKKGGMTHTVFTRAVRILAGPSYEPQLRGTLVDVGRENRDVLTNRQVVEPEGFPNSFVRGASGLYLRVGVFVEAAGAQSEATAHASASKGPHLQVYAEPCIPEGGIVFGGPITLRVVENEGQCREFSRTLKNDGSRCDWGPVFLHAKPVTTTRQQTAASGAIESGGGPPPSKSGTSDGAHPGADDEAKNLGDASATDSIFSSNLLHGMGYQALELVRLTNRSPLLWIRVDPHGLYSGRISVVQPDACLSEQLFHDGDAKGQIDAIRTLAERPSRIQGSVKISSVFDVNVTELPVRVLGDCLRGSPALHSSLPHTPAVRAQAALAIAQWQNNKAPNSRNAVGSESWLGLNILIQYFKERYYSNEIVMPAKFGRLVLKNPASEGGNKDTSDSAASSGGYKYWDMIDEDERASSLENAAEIEVEEDEEYRVRSAVITAIASIRAKDGMTPAVVLHFLQTVLTSGDGSVVGKMISADEENVLRSKRSRIRTDMEEKTIESYDSDKGTEEDDIAGMPYVSCTLLADALLALCHVNVRPDVIDHPVTGTVSQSKAQHPIVPLMEECYRILQWELYQEHMRIEKDRYNSSSVGGQCHSTVASCAISSLCSLALLKQTTADAGPIVEGINANSGSKRKNDPNTKNLEDATMASFYANIFDSHPPRSDITRAAAAQAVACICCAVDRFEDDNKEPIGLLTSLEFMLDRILDPSVSPGLRQTLATLMLDSCTGKVCSMQRTASLGGRSDLCSAGARFMTGPLGASHGGDNGTSLLMAVSEQTSPAANAVNSGARRGLSLLKKAGRDASNSDQTIVRVGRFATLLWRTLNGELVEPYCSVLPPSSSASVSPGLVGVCAYDGHLRCSLLAVWQWLWPKLCFAVLRVQTWKPHEGTQRYKDLGADHVMKMSDEEKNLAILEEASCADLNNVVAAEMDRQLWRGDMAMKAYEHWKKDDEKGTVKDPTVSMHPLPMVEKDQAWKLGGWLASTAQQRRVKGLDGGTAVTKIRLTVKNSSGE